MNMRIAGLPAWTVAAPVLGLLALLAGKPVGAALLTTFAVLLAATVLAAVHHAEVVAHALGEPFGTLVLALAVTVIETSLIVALTLSDPAGAATLARDTVYAAVMIVLNGIVGVCLLAGGTRHHEQHYTQYGVSAGLGMLSVLSVLTLVLPNLTTSTPGPTYTVSQLVFVAIVSVVIYAAFVLAQTVRHREDFLHGADDEHAAAAGRGAAIASFVLMLGALVAVVLLAKALSPAIKGGVASVGAPAATVGIIIAALVLAPEGLAAHRAARQDKLQTSLNLAIGSALASIGLTIPAVCAVSVWLGLGLELGLPPKESLLLVLTLFVASLSLSTGRTTVVQGVVHLVLFATFLFTTLVP